MCSDSFRASEVQFSSAATDITIFLLLLQKKLRIPIADGYTIM